MNALNEDAIQALQNLSSLEQKYCLKLATQLKKLGLQHHASDAICAIAECPAMPIKY